MNVVLFIVVVLICYIVSTMIHEMGHVVCGLLHGWKLYILVVGPMKLYREDMDSKIRIGIEKNPILWGGIGGTLPAKEAPENEKVWSRILLAGPLTSLVFGVLMMPVVIVTESVMADLLCLMPIAMGLACIIPMKMKTGFLYNDGTRYKRLHSGGQEGAEEVALFKLIEVSLFGGERCIYPVNYVESLLASADKDLQYYGYFYAYCNAIRQNRIEEAEEQLANMENIRDKVSKVIVDDCKVEGV